MKKIILEKIEELENAFHPNNKKVGYIRKGIMVDKPRVGASFIMMPPFRTSVVTEIIDKNTFKTLNSIYKITHICQEENH